MIEVTQTITLEGQEIPVAAEVTVPGANARYFMALLSAVSAKHDFQPGGCGHVECFHQLSMRFEMSFN